MARRALRPYPAASQGLVAVRQGPIAERVVRPGSWIPDPAWKERRKVGHGGLTFRPRDPCSPAGPSGPRGPWNRKKGLAQWTAGVSLGLGTRRQGCPEPWAFPCTSLGLPPPPTNCHPEMGHPCAMCLLKWLCRGLTWVVSATGPTILEWRRWYI